MIFSVNVPYSFVVPTFEELDKLGGILGVSAEEAKAVIPNLSEQKELPYRESIRGIYALYLCRKLLETSNPQTSPAVPSTQPPTAQSSKNIPSMEALANLRVRIHLKQSQAALFLNVTDSVLSNWETGKVIPTLDERRRYYEILIECQNGERPYRKTLRQRTRGIMMNQPNRQMTF